MLTVLAIIGLSIPGWAEALGIAFVTIIVI